MRRHIELAPEYSASQVKLIIQIPCLNEEATLPATIADLPRQIDGIDAIELLVDRRRLDRPHGRGRARARRRAHRPPDQQQGPRRGLSGRARRLPEARRRRNRQHRRRQPVPRRRHSKAARPDRGRRGRHGRRRPSRRPDRALPRPQEGPAAARQLGGARISGTEIADTPSGFRAYNREAALRPAHHRQLHLHVGEPDPGGRDPGRRRPGRRSAPTRRRGSPASSPRPAPTCGATRAAILRIYARYEPLRVFSTAGLIVERAGAGRLDAFPDRLDLQRQQHRPHPVADPRRRPLHRLGPALSPSA